MKKVKFRVIISGLFSIVTGVMLALLRGSVLSLILTVIGVGFIVTSLPNKIIYLKNINKFHIIRIVIGICMIIFANTFINLSMYMLGIALIIYGIFDFISCRSITKRFSSLYIRPVLTLVAGICITFNPMGSMETLFLVCGILLIAGGVCDLYRGITLRV